MMIMMIGDNDDSDDDIDYNGNDDDCDSQCTDHHHLDQSTPTTILT